MYTTISTMLVDSQKTQVSMLIAELLENAGKGAPTGTNQTAEQQKQSWREAYDKAATIALSHQLNVFRAMRYARLQLSAMVAINSWDLDKAWRELRIAWATDKDITRIDALGETLIEMIPVAGYEDALEQARLQDILDGKVPIEELTDEEKEHFKSMFTQAEAAYQDMKGRLEAIGLYPGENI